MSVAVIHQYEKNNDAAADFHVMHAETKQLQKMSLADPQEQNKENDLVGSGSNLFQTPPPGAFSCVGNDTEAAKEWMKRQREWHALHSCTKCGVCKHSCWCNVRSPRWSHWDRRSEFLKIQGKKKKIYDDNALPPWLAKQRQEVLEDAKNLDLSLFRSSIQKK